MEQLVHYQHFVTKDGMTKGCVLSGFSIVSKTSGITAFEMWIMAKAYIPWGADAVMPTHLPALTTLVPVPASIYLRLSLTIKALAAPFKAAKELLGEILHTLGSKPQSVMVVGG